MRILDYINRKQLPDTIRRSDVCFVNFANGPYLKGQQDLIRSIRKHSSYDILAFTKYEEIGSPSHQESPYEFKLHAIQTAKNKGYTTVIWCDASMRLIRPIDDLLPKIEELGVYVQQDGWSIGQWANDKTLEYFRITRDDALNIPNAYACIFAVNFNTKLSLVFLSELFKCSNAGLFKGQWHNKFKTESEDERCLGHRHDQSCIELVCYKLSINKQPMLVGNKTYINRYFSSWDNL